MIRIHKLLQVAAAVSAIAIAGACGGGSTASSGTGTGSGSGSGGSGGSGGTTNNVANLIVDAGPGGIGDEDLAFVTVTVCVPGTSTCQTIDHVQVDTGSEGLRIVQNGVLNLSLPQQTSNGNSIMECTQFGDLTYIWGPVASADIKISGETATSVPVQIIGGTNQAQAVPSACSSGEVGQIVDVPTLGANAIIGVGPFKQDCGLGCANAAASPNYYACNAGGCNPTMESLTAQLQNPVWMFPSDNNGVIVQLPSVSDSGQATATGSLIFGIGTQSNNGLGNASVLQVDPNIGNFTVSFQNSTSSATYTDVNFIDSGSNGFFFLDSATLTNQFGIPIPDCPSSSLQGFYCPGSTIAFSPSPGVGTVSLIGNTASGTPIGSSRTVTFNLANAQTLFTTASNSVFDDVGGPNSGTFDFGLPFFFGRSVYTAIEGQSTPGGTGPYFAF